MALGCLGLSLDDFCALSPDEFNQVHKAHIDAEIERLHGDWDRMRTQTTYLMQPHFNKQLDAKKLMPFPWEKEQKKKAPSSTEKRRQELAERFKDL